MSDIENKLTLWQDTDLGSTMAMQDLLRALLKTHPDIGAVARAIYLEREETMAVMLAKNWSDTTITSYRDTIDSIRPHRDGDDMSPP